jgi:transcriptional regulator with XRE-family HTH domain
MEVAMTDLRTAREEAGLSQHAYSVKSGVSQSDVSKFESGAKLMGESVAQRLARYLPRTTPGELLIGNKAAAFQRAQERGDRLGVLKAAESFVKYAERLPEDPELERMLNRLVEKACEFAEGGSGASEESFADGFRAEGRNPHTGVKVDKSTAQANEDKGAYPLWAAHQDPPPTAFSSRVVGVLLSTGHP